MKALFLGLFLSASVSSAALDVVTVKSTETSENYQEAVTYELLKFEASPVAWEINKAVKSEKNQFACDAADAAQADIGMKQDMSATLTAYAINENYISYQVSWDNYCGGAYPNADWYLLTFNTQTGEKLNLNLEVGLNPDADLSDAGNAAIRTKLAELLLKYGAKEDVENCFTGTAQENLEQMEGFYPYVDGLNDKKEVVLSFGPPHVAMACKYQAALTYDQIKDLIVPGSYLETWLK